MKIKVVALDCLGITPGLDERRYNINKEGKCCTASCFEVPSTEDIKKFYERVEEALKITGKLKKTTKKEDFVDRVSYTTNCYLAGNCLVENTLVLNVLHRIKVAGKSEDVEEILREKPEFLMAYERMFERQYGAGEDLNLNNFNSISDLEKAVS